MNSDLVRIMTLPFRQKQMKQNKIDEETYIQRMCDYNRDNLGPLLIDYEYLNTCTFKDIKWLYHILLILWIIYLTYLVSTSLLLHCFLHTIAKTCLTSFHSYYSLAILLLISSLPI